MPWLRLDDRFVHHPKVRPLSDKAFRLWLHLLNHCAEFSTDGAVDNSAMRAAHEAVSLRFTRRSKSLSELVTRGLVAVSDEGWNVHDFLDYNPSLAEVQANRAATAERVRRHRERRNGVTNALVTGPRPDPAPKEEINKEESNDRPLDNSPWARQPTPRHERLTGDPDLDAELKKQCRS